MPGPIVQEYAVDRRGRRYPVHTRRCGSCRCRACWARAWWTPERRSERGAEIRRQYDDGRRTWHPASNLARANHWTPERDGLLRELAGHVDMRSLIERLSARFGYAYTASAVKHRIQRLGIWILDRRPLTSGEVARLLGMSRNNLHATWVETGRLRPERWPGGPHGTFVYRRAALERFVREYAESLNVARIRDSELRALAQAVLRGRHGVGTRDVERLTGVPHQIQVALFAARLVPSARRVRRFGGGAGGSWLIDRADVELVRRLAIERQADIDRRRLARGRDASGRFVGAAG